jgi:hypothetical protein
MMIIPDCVDPEYIDPEQAWFWDSTWLFGEREASEQIKAGDTKIFLTAEAFLQSLREEEEVF